MSVKKVGLVISQEKPHLACSPEKFVEDTSAVDTHGTAEYKSPYSASRGRHSTRRLLVLLQPVPIFCQQRQALNSKAFTATLKMADQC